MTIVGGGDRRTYQEDVANAREALAEIEFDVAEGADMVDGEACAHQPRHHQPGSGAVDVPICAYQVSGEYAMVKAAAENGWIDGAAVAAEQLLSIKRAGADFVLTYFAGELAEALGG